MSDPVEDYFGGPFQSSLSDGAKVWELLEPSTNGHVNQAEMIDDTNSPLPEPPPVDRDAEAAWEQAANETHGKLTPIEAVDDPIRLGRLHIETSYKYEDGPTLYSHQDVFQKWTGQSYIELPKGELKAALVVMAKQEFDKANLAAQEAPRDEGKPPPTVKKVTTKLITDVVQAVSSLTILPGSIEQPAWLNCEAPFPASEIMACRNGLIHLPSLVANKPHFKPHTPRFFNSTALDYDFDAEAPAPKAWLEFLKEIWANDQASIETLQEWFGYLLTPDTRQQKILLILGPKRAGKGTLARVLRGMIGLANVAGPTLAGLATNFGLWPLLGKTAAIINDARLSGKTDAAIVIERLLSISGEDAITVDRKFLLPLTVKLPTRITIITNELPKLGDSSGALTGRMILLRLTRSWYGKEDVYLTDRLMAELPGILLWSIAGWQRLNERGHFVQPDAGKELIEDLEDLSSPIGAFVRECCDIGPARQVRFEALFSRWQEWCIQNGRKDPGRTEVFARDLLAALPVIRKTRPRDGAERYRAYEGIGLKYT